MLAQRNPAQPAAFYHWRGKTSAAILFCFSFLLVVTSFYPKGVDAAAAPGVFSLPSPPASLQLINSASKPQAYRDKTSWRAALTETGGSERLAIADSTQLAQGSNIGKAAKFIGGGLLSGVFSLLSGATEAMGAFLANWLIITVIGFAVQQIVGGLFIWATRTTVGLMTYNDFLAAPVVSEGWLVVRDVANMFFVIILLIIAFATILGIKSYSAQSLLKPFLFAAILINFSKTIMGLLIDASSVVMLTFAAGLTQTAGGNFVSLFQVSKWFQASQVFKGVNAGGGFTGATIDVAGTIIGPFISQIFGIIIVVAALTAILTYLALIVGRIVTLWILIIVSPLAFVASILPKTKEYAGQFWKTLTNQLLVGPVIAFILWLALSVVQIKEKAFDLLCSNSVNAAVGSCPGGGADYYKETGAFPAITNTGIAEWNNLAQFVVALAFLLGGAAFAKKMAGGIGAMISDKLTGAVKGVYGKGKGLYTKYAGLSGSKVGVTTAAKRAFLGKAELAPAVVGKIPFVGGVARRGYERAQAYQRGYIEKGKQFFGPEGPEKAQAAGEAAVRQARLRRRIGEAREAGVEVSEAEERAAMKKAYEKATQQAVEKGKKRIEDTGVTKTPQVLLQEARQRAEGKGEGALKFDMDLEAMRQAFIGSISHVTEEKNKLEERIHKADEGEITISPAEREEMEEELEALRQQEETLLPLKHEWKAGQAPPGTPGAIEGGEAGGPAGGMQTPDQARVALVSGDAKRAEKTMNDIASMIKRDRGAASKGEFSREDADEMAKTLVRAITAGLSKTDVKGLTAGMQTRGAALPDSFVNELVAAAPDVRELIRQPEPKAPPNEGEPQPSTQKPPPQIDVKQYVNAQGGEVIAGSLKELMKQIQATINRPDGKLPDLKFTDDMMQAPEGGQSALAVELSTMVKDVATLRQVIYHQGNETKRSVLKAVAKAKEKSTAGFDSDIVRVAAEELAKLENSEF